MSERVTLRPDSEFDVTLRATLAGDPPDFGDRLAARGVAEWRAALRAVEPSPARRAWLVAALMVLGMGVVWAVSMAGDRSTTVRDGPDPVPRQDPELPREFLPQSWEELVEALDSVRSVTLTPLVSHVFAGSTASMVLEIESAAETLDDDIMREWTASLRGVESVDSTPKATAGWALAGGASPVTVQFDTHRGAVNATLSIRGPHAVLVSEAGTAKLPSEAGAMAGRLARLAHLAKELFVGASSVDELLAASPSARELIWTGDVASDLTPHIDRFRSLRRLIVLANGCDQSLVDAVSECTDLEGLAVMPRPFGTDRETPPNPVALDGLSSCSKLRKIHFERLRFDPSPLATLSSLNTLTLRDCELTGPGLHLIATLPVETLRLDLIDSTEREAKALAKLKKVRLLKLTTRDAAFADACLEAAAQVPTLRRLELDLPAAELDLVERLSAFDHLHVLDLSPMDLDAAQLDAIASALPEVHLIRG